MKSTSHPVWHPLLHVLVLGLMVGCGPSVPGGSAEYIARRDAYMRAEMYGGFQALLADWGRAVADGAVDRAYAMYTDGARVRLDYLAVGAEIRPALAEWFDAVDNVIMGPADFDFSGELAYGVVRVLVVPSDGGPRETGIMTVVARSTSAGWFIRGQFLTLQ